MRDQGAIFRRKSDSRSLAAGLGLFLLLFGSGCDSLSSPGKGASSSPGKEEFRSLELDLFTLTFHATRSGLGEEFLLTDEGGKYYLDGSREAGFPSDVRGIYVVPDFEPARWEAYLCVERRALFSDSFPGKPPVATMMSGDSIRYYYFLEDPGDGACRKHIVGYIFGKGFLIVPGFIGVGTLTIRYR